MFLVGAHPGVVYGCPRLHLPESPRYLIAQGKDEEAHKVLQSVAPDDDVETDTCATSRTHRGGQVAEPEGAPCAARPSGCSPIVWIGIVLSVLQQFVGINVIFYYSTTLWQAVGFPENDSLTISVITAVTNILVTLVAIALVDRIGRRPLLLAGSIGMAVSLGDGAGSRATGPATRSRCPARGAPSH